MDGECSVSQTNSDHVKITPRICNLYLGINYLLLYNLDLMTLK